MLILRKRLQLKPIGDRVIDALKPDEFELCADFLRNVVIVPAESRRQT